MNKFLIISSFILLIELSGCAGISFMGLQDAETLGKGNSSLGFSVSKGSRTTNLYLDSAQQVHDITSGSFSPVEVHFQTGLSNDLDIGIFVWNSSLLSSFRVMPKVSSYDIGANVSLKYRLTDSMAIRNVAVSIAFIGQRIGYLDGDDGWRYLGLGVAPEIMYSRSFAREASENSLGKSFLSRFVLRMQG